MNTTHITLRTDIKTKDSIASFAKELGLSTGAFMMAAARDAMDRGQVTLRAPHYPKELVDAVKESRAEYRRGDYHHTETPEDALRLLDSWSNNAR